MSQVRITLFTQPDCPKCPAAKKAVEELKQEKGFEVEEINTKTDEGYFRAIEHNLLSTPAVVIGGTVKPITITGQIDKKRIVSTLEEMGA